MKEVSKKGWVHPASPGGVDEIHYESGVDGVSDRALVRRPVAGERRWIVYLHGHGSSGDQLYTRGDIRREWLARFREFGLGILSPDLRGNAWMCPEAVEDLHVLLNWLRAEYGACDFYFAGGSMGGSGTLIYATRRPEDVAAAAALCAVSDLREYEGWCARRPEGVRGEIRSAIHAAYGGSPAEAPGRYAEHVVLEHAAALTMPLYLAHATGDTVIPVHHSRRLRAALKEPFRGAYCEIEGGDHDSPLHHGGLFDWLADRIGGGY